MTSLHLLLMRTGLVIVLSVLSGITWADSIRFATTTSTYNSGLLDYLVGHYEKVSDTQVLVISVGTGKALKMGENGDVDLVMTHAPIAEAHFVDEKFGIEPLSVMYNDFVLVGPKEDLASVSQAQTVIEGLALIMGSNQRFISRGDDSGTHKKELQLWQHLGQLPTFSGYLESGRGMGHSLHMASEMGAYTLTDRGTWLALKGKLQLHLALDSDPKLINPYQVILVNPQRHAHVNVDSARDFAQWIVSPAGQALISAFRINGEVLFIPSATPPVL
ncbi:MAG: substrate-binding domain-containing protein [Oceanospirillaceae bacterium]|nr:substrate-binding domain-containing protein [Oceanospirillaceae bacterium]